MRKDELIEHLREKGLQESILKAFSEVNRESFLPEHLSSYAYDDIAIPIESGAALSQPSTIAFMLELLNPQKGQKILEIGSGSGYVLALLSSIIEKGEIYGLEIKKNIAIKAKKRLSDKKNIHILYSDGSNGYPAAAPFDRILFSAACQYLATAESLLPQLKDHGIIVAPVKDSIIQIVKSSGIIEKHEFPGFAFVPLVSKEE